MPRGHPLLEQVKLTATVKAAGCAAKLSPSVLDTVLRRLPQQIDNNVLVGFETSDDAGVYRLSGGLALVQTVDFFTPIVDDPFSFGQIAAANALSDVYAMGGRPISALSIVAFPEKGALEVLEQILRLHPESARARVFSAWDCVGGVTGVTDRGNSKEVQVCFPKRLPEWDKLARRVPSRLPEGAFVRCHARRPSLLAHLDVEASP